MNAAATSVACATMALGTPILQTHQLVKRFGGLLATDHVDLAVHAGEVHALIGPNGAGKTTLINQLSAELRSDSGQILWRGRDITTLPVAQRARLGLARSFQITQVCKDFTALDNVMLAANTVAGRRRFWTPLHQDKAVVDQSHALLATVGLADKAQTVAGVMSHGEHRQLELAMALALPPQVLLLDEPLAGMSLAEGQVMIELLQSLKGRVGMLMVEHDMPAVFQLADRLSVLVYGKVIATGTPQDIQNNAEVQSAYLGHEA